MTAVLSPAVSEAKRERDRILPYRRVPPLLQKLDPEVAQSLDGRFKSRRERASELRARMGSFSRIYNSAWLVRQAYFGPDQRQRKAVMGLIAVLLSELPETRDYEGMLFALADALYSSPHGVPWEA
jgi:hypothetical protein